MVLNLRLASVLKSKFLRSLDIKIYPTAAETHMATVPHKHILSTDFIFLDPPAPAANAPEIARKSIAKAY